jgi:hypothetical protein
MQDLYNSTLKQYIKDQKYSTIWGEIVDGWAKSVSAGVPSNESQKNSTSAHTYVGRVLEMAGCANRPNNFPTSISAK